MTRLTRGMERPEAVAGLFYDRSPGALRDRLETLMAQAQVHDGARDHATKQPALPRALLVPHAGYVFSGPMAATAFAAAPAPRRVIIVAPAHTVAFPGISVGDFSAYRTPLGPVPVDRDAAYALLDTGLCAVFPSAHAREHAVEVMLPFVLHRWGPVPIVPLLVSEASIADVELTLDQTMAPGDLLLISSDLSHFHPYRDAQRRDRRTLEAVRRGDWRALTGEDACGYKGLAATMRLAKRRGWTTTLLGYQNSGDTAGDQDRVVGYGAAAFTA